MYEIFNIPLPEPKVLILEEFYNLMQNQKYRGHYERLVNRARDRILEGYVERHHIIPKCLTGEDEEANLVYLTAREHFVAHQILTILFPKIYKLAHAAQLMTVDALGNRVNNRLYKWLRERLSEAAKNKVFSEETRLKMSISQKNRVITPEQKERMMIGLRIGWETPITPEQRAKMSASMKGRIIPPEHIEKLRIANLGRKASPEACAKMSESRKNPSAEVRANMAKGQMGRKHKPESIAKIAYNNSIREVTEETRAKMSKTHSNMSDERKSNIGAASKIARQREKELGIGMYSEESRLKRNASVKAFWDRKKLERFMSEGVYEVSK